MAYAYTPLGALTALTYPDGSAKVDFATNGFGQATQAKRGGDVFADNAQYYPSGSIDTFTYGNGVVHKTHLNSRLLPAQITDQYRSVDRLNLSYTYDYNNNIKSLTNARGAGKYSLTDLGYDGLDRLTATTGGSAIGSSRLTYDGLGNIRTYSNTSSADAHNLSYSYTNNRLSRVAGTGSTGYAFNRADSYDNRGNTTHNGKRSFSYNLANQMTESGDNRYVYDGYNRRIKTTDSKGISYSMYSQSGKLL